MSRGRPQEPERKTTRVHTGFQQDARFVRDRHPDPAKGDKPWGGFPPATIVHEVPGEYDCNCDPNRQHADNTTYVMEDWSGLSDPPTIPSTDGCPWPTYGNPWMFGDHMQYYYGSWAENYEPWTNHGAQGSSRSYVGSEVGMVTAREDTPACAQSAWFKAYGWKYRETWYQYEVPCWPSDAAGIMWKAPGLESNDQSAGNNYGYYNKVAGYNVHVLQGGWPAAKRSGTVVAHYYPWDVQGDAWIFIPINLIPAEGEILYIGVAPNWDTIPGHPINGPCWYSDDITSTHWPVDDMKTSEAYGGTYLTTPPYWMSYDGAAGDFGFGSSGEDQGAWFAGNLPWVVETSGGATWEVDGTVFRATGPGNVKLTMEGADVVVTEPDEEDDLDLDDMGEPWSNELGARLGLRYRILSAIDAAVAGVRDFTMRWNDHSGWVGLTRHFGDPTNAAGVTLAADGVTETVAMDHPAQTWLPLWLDTRMVTAVRGRAWDEAYANFPYSGEKTDILELQRDVLYEDEDQNVFEVEMNLGDGQQVEIDTVWVRGPGEDGQIVHEHAGSGDGTRILMLASQPYTPGSVQADVAGVAVRAQDVTPLNAEFQSVDAAAVPDDTRIDLTFRVQREVGYGEDDEEPSGDDTADDEDAP